MSKLLDSGSEEPVASEPSARDAAGFANSNLEPVQPVRHGPSFPLARALAVVLIAGTSLASPLLGSFTQCFAIAIMALGIARGARGWYAAVCIVGSGIVAGALTSGAGVDGRWVAAAVVGAVLTGLLGIEQWRAAKPDPVFGDDELDVRPGIRTTEPREMTLAEQMAAANPQAARVLPQPQAQSWPEPRADRGISYATYTWLVAAIVLVAFIGVAVGTHRASTALQSNIRTGFADYDRTCAKGGILASDKQTCKQFHETQSSLLRAARDHAPLILALFAALSVAGGAWTSHIIVIARNRALAAQGWGIATRPSYKLRQLEFHWSWAYVGVVGVLGMIVAHAFLHGMTQEWTLAAGAGLAATAGQVLAMHGAGVAAWVLSRRPLPWWYRIVLIFTLIFAWPFVLGALLLAGALDMQFRIRRRLVALAANAAL